MVSISGRIQDLNPNEGQRHDYSMQTAAYLLVTGTGTRWLTELASWNRDLNNVIDGHLLRDVHDVTKTKHKFRKTTNVRKG
jgi:hypothetical protein